MLQKNIITKNTGNIDKKIFDYGKELVMLNFLFEMKLLSEKEMVEIKNDIMNSYNSKDENILL